MRIIEPGHIYVPDNYDSITTHGNVPLRFFKRVGDNFPFNEGKPHGGTNCQDIIRVLIDRVKYLNMQKEHPNNEKIISRLRHALWLFEDRHARLHERILKHSDYLIEEVPTCPKCGHIECQEH